MNATNPSQILDLSMLNASSLVADYAKKVLMKKGRTVLPGVLGKGENRDLILKPLMVYQRKYVGFGASNPDKFFDSFDTSKPFENNQKETVVPNNEVWLITGISMRQATLAAANTALSTASFVTVANANLLNGLFKITVGAKEVCPEIPVQGAFVNAGEVNDLFRLPNPVLAEPNDSFVVEKRNVPFTTGEFFAVEFTLYGVKISE